MKTFRVSILTMLTALLSFTMAIGQDYYFDNYNVRHGLAQSKVHSIIQDSDGYVWLGTASGLSKFDGRVFLNYNQNNGLAPNGIRAIHQNADGTIWFGHTGGGISRYNGKVFEAIENDSLIINSDVTYIIPEGDNALWVATAGTGAVLLTDINGPVSEIKYQFFTGRQGLSDQVFSGTRLLNGDLILITDFGLKKYNSSNDIFENYILEGMPTYFQITSIYQDSKQDIWIGTYNGGLYQIMPDKKNRIYDIRDGLGGQFVTYITSDKYGDIWVGHWGGGITRISEGKLKVYDASNGLQDLKIWTIVEDREGNILIGTNETGLLIFKGEQFVTYSTNNILYDNQVWAVLQDSKGRMWVGTNGGIHLYDPNASPINRIKLFNADNTIGISSNQVRFLREDKKGTIWAGFWDEGGIREYNDQSKTFRYSILVNNFIRRSRFNITAMDIDRENNLWVGTVDGLVYYEIENNRIDRITHIDGLAGNDVSAIFTDSRNTVWIGSRGKGITRIKGTEIEEINLGTVFTPVCIAEDADGNIVIGTESQGILVYDGEKLIRKISTDDGLLSDFVTSIAIDKHGNLMIGTNRGLNKYNIETREMLTYSEKIGFVGIEVKENAIFRDRNGNMWFGTVNGLIRFNPEKERVNRLEPMTHITKFMVNLNDKEMTDGIKLHHSEKSIYFEFNGICLSDPDVVRFQYMLQGADDDWQPVTNQQFANYSPLPPGKYTFKVIARNNTGLWNENPVQFSFEIRPPFWKTWWFYMIVFITGFIVLVTYIKIRERNLIAEKRILEEKVIERTIEISEKNAELARINKDITDSINYARRIQTAIMPPVKELKKLLPECFIFYRPKDIVSGDFYWFTEKDNKIILVAADCTGHGVPGAFMSMIGVSFLSEIVNEKGITHTDKILNLLRESIIAVLKQSDSEHDSKDGMDIALLSIDKSHNEIVFSGAYNSLYQVRQNIKQDLFSENANFHEDHLLEHKADRMPIGISDKRSKPFSSAVVSAKTNDMLYIFTDGFMDQFGGEKGRKYLSRNFKSLLVEISNLPADRQQEELGKRFDEWIGDYEQIDDVLIIGIKI